MSQTGEPQEAAGLSRRRFLEWATAGLGCLAGLALGGAGGAYFLSPLFRKKDEDWVDIGPAKAAGKSGPVKVEFVARRRDAWTTAERRSTAWVMSSDGGNFVVFDPRCTHLGCPYRWDEERRQFLCPCHAGIFDIDGKVVGGPPPRPLDRYPAKVVAGRLLILPLAARSAS